MAEALSAGALLRDAKFCRAQSGSIEACKKGYGGCTCPFEVVDADHPPFEIVPVDPRLLDILGSSIGSIWALELLLILRRDPARTWTSAALVTELRSSDLVVSQSIERLERGGLVVRDDDGAVRFAPATPDLETAITSIDDEYRLRPGAVRRAIIAAPDDKLKSFSDAFLFRKPPK
jgi:hypothetical protein